MVAVDYNQETIAVCGIRGFCIYFISTMKWKLFGNESIEQSFHASGGVVWFNDILILSSFNISSLDYSLKFYNKFLNLDDSFCLLIKNTSQIVCMDILDSNLLILLHDFTLVHYNIKLINDKIVLDTISTISISRHISSCSSICWYPPPTESITIETIQKSPLIILEKTGELKLLENDSIKTISKNISFFWMSRPTERISDLYNSLWAFNPTGVEIFTNLIVNNQVLNSRFQWRVNPTGENIFIPLSFNPSSIFNLF